MGLITKPNTFSSGATIIAAEHNGNFDTIYTEINGNIDNANVKASAGIVGSKLDLSAPGVIGATTPAVGSFTNLGVTVVEASTGNSTGTTGQFLQVTGSNVAWINSFTDRGDPAAFDFTLSDFTTDGNWHSTDLSTIISPSNVKVVLMRFQIESAEANKSVRLRTTGSNNEISVSEAVTQVINIPIILEAMIPLTSDKFIEYSIPSADYTNLNLVVKGWWF